MGCTANSGTHTGQPGQRPKRHQPAHATRSLREEHFSITQGACLLGKAGRAVFYVSWERGSKPLRRWLRLQTQHLARQLRTQGMAWVLADDDDEATPS